MSTNTKNIYINEFNDMETSLNISDSDLYLLIKKIDNINDYLNILTIEVNKIKKYIKINSYNQDTQNTQNIVLPTYQNIVLPTYQNKEIPFYKEPNSYYDLNPDIIFK